MRGIRSRCCLGRESWAWQRTDSLRGVKEDSQRATEQPLTSGNTFSQEDRLELSRLSDSRVPSAGGAQAEAAHPPLLGWRGGWHTGFRYHMSVLGDRGPFAMTLFSVGGYGDWGRAGGHGSIAGLSSSVEAGWIGQALVNEVGTGSR